MLHTNPIETPVQRLQGFRVAAVVLQILKLAILLCTAFEDTLNEF